MFIQRDYSRTEHDDFVINVEKHCGDNKEAVPVYHPEEGYVMGWKIQNIRE